MNKKWMRFLAVAAVLIGATMVAGCGYHDHDDDYHHAHYWGHHYHDCN